MELPSVIAEDGHVGKAVRPERALGSRQSVHRNTWDVGVSTACWPLCVGIPCFGTRKQRLAELYCADNGRDSVPPSLLATALLLQTYDRASDAEAKQRADFDIRWKVALGIEVEVQAVRQEYASAVSGAPDTA